MKIDHPPAAATDVKIYETMSLELHTGQVLYLTRLRLGDEYVESLMPATAEQAREFRVARIHGER